jgi:hypothetical protein
MILCADSCRTRISIAQTWKASHRCTMLRVRAIFKSPSIWWRTASATQNFRTTLASRLGSARYYRAGRRWQNIYCRYEGVITAHFQISEILESLDGKKPSPWI